MASILYSPLVNKISGSTGGGTMQAGRFGNVVKRKSIPSQPVSNSSASVRSSFGATSTLWKTINSSLVAGWNNLAKSVKLTAKFGESYTPSGFQLFSTLNKNLAAIGVSPITAVPAAAVVATMNSMSLASDNSDQSLTLTYSPAVPADEKFVIMATAAIPVGRKVTASDFRKIGVLATANTSPYTLTTLYLAKFGVIGAAGDVIYVQVRPIHATAGWGGQPFAASAVIAV